MKVLFEKITNRKVLLFLSLFCLGFSPIRADELYPVKDFGQPPAKEEPAKAIPTEVEPTVGTTSKPSEVFQTNLRQATMRISGSMCLSCLRHLEMKLSRLWGVAQVKLERPMAGLQMTAAPDFSSWASLSITYDSELFTLQKLKTYLRTKGYNPYKITDAEVEKVGQ